MGLSQIRPGTKGMNITHKMQAISH